MAIEESRMAMTMALLIAVVWGFGAHASFVNAAGSGECSRKMSREVRHVLDQVLYKYLDRTNVTLSADCPWAKEKDMYLVHEQHKQKTKNHEWKSLYSKKLFKSEYYIDKHMDNRHMSKIPKEATICLADYCDIFQCPEEFRARRPCILSEIQKTRNLCQTILDKCLPSSGSEIVQAVYDRVQRDLCNNLNCKDKHRILKLKANDHSGAFFAWVLATIFLFIGLVIYYVSLVYNTSELRIRGDLQRINRKRHKKNVLFSWWKQKRY